MLGKFNAMYSLPLASRSYHSQSSSTRFAHFSASGLAPLLLTPSIGGKSVAMGYYSRPDITADKFRPHPLQDGKTVYMTGDLGAWSPDWNLKFFGRMDYQVKIRGYRVELGEIENVLMRHLSVTKAVVTVRDKHNLVATVVSDSKFDAQSVLDLAKKHLPFYMLPSAFQVVEDFPLTPTGKIDRKKLRRKLSGLMVEKRRIFEGDLPFTKFGKLVCSCVAEFFDREVVFMFSGGV